MKVGLGSLVQVQNRVMSEIAGKSKPGLGLYEFGRVYDQVKLSEVPPQHQKLVKAAIASDPSIQVKPGVIDTAKLEKFLNTVSDAFVKADEKHGLFGLRGGNQNFTVELNEAQGVFKKYGEAAKVLYAETEQLDSAGPVHVRPSPEDLAYDAAIKNAKVVDIGAPKGTPEKKAITFINPSTDDEYGFARLGPQVDGRMIKNFAGGNGMGLNRILDVAKWSSGNLLVTNANINGYNTVKLYVPKDAKLEGISPNPGFEVTSPPLAAPQGAEPGGKWLWITAKPSLHGGEAPDSKHPGSPGDSMRFRLSWPGSDFPTTEFSLTTVAFADN